MATREGTFFLKQPIFNGFQKWCLNDFFVKITDRNKKGPRGILIFYILGDW